MGGDTPRDIMPEPYEENSVVGTAARGVLFAVALLGYVVVLVSPLMFIAWVFGMMGA